MMKPIIHGVAGGAALILASTFWLSTLVVELSSDLHLTTLVKTGIVTAMWVFVPLIAIAGGSGFSLARGWRSAVVARKRRRMRIVAAIGLLVLLPCAYFLAQRAVSGEFGTSFYAVQAVELAFGAINIGLLTRNMRDGLAMRRRRRAVA